MKRIASILVCLVMLGFNALAQDIQITGKVTSADDGSSLPGVSVVVKGTTTGTSTNIDGNFTITASSEATLVFSSIGMETQEVVVGGQTVIDVVMQSEAISMDEVVITALGIPRDVKALGYSATNVDSDEIERSMSNDVANAISGKIAGVQVSSTGGGPGTSNSVIIRGITSLTDGDNQPLYVVDGVPINNNVRNSDDELNNGYDYGNGANLINPDDVESMTVLKGAAASALYGGRAANGVVMITTKSGKSRKGVGVTFTTGYELSDILRIPEFQNEYGMGWSGEHTMIENGSWGPKLDGSDQLWGTVYNNSQKIKPFSAQPDNVKDFFEYGHSFNNSLALNGGNEKTTFFASLSQLSSDGPIPSDVDKYNRYSIRLNASHQASENLKVSSNLAYSHQKNEYALTGQGLTIINSLYQIPRDVSIIGLKDYENDPFNSLDYYFTPYGVANPYFLIDKKENLYKRDKLFGKIDVEWTIIDELKALYRLGVDVSNGQSKLGNPEIKATPGTPNEGQIDEPGRVYTYADRRFEINHDVMLTYDKQLATNFRINALGGLNTNERTVRWTESEVNGLDLPYFYSLKNSPATPIIDEYTEKRRSVSLYGQVELAFWELLYATVSARNDWTSTLPEDNRSFFYPGVSLGFNFSELLPSLSDIIDFGTLRLAYGITGKDADPYLVPPVFIPAEIYNEFGNMIFPFAGVNAYELSNRLGSLDLQPEITREMEVGLRMDFLKGRIGFDVSYYDKLSDKQIFTLDMDPGTGYTSQVTNIGEISNKGIELLVTLVPVRTNDFKWSISFNFAKNTSELVSLPEELGGEDGEIDFYGFGNTASSTHLVGRVGEPVGLFKVTVPKKSPDGQIIVNAETGAPVQTDPAVVGDCNYDYTMGLGNIISYKGLSLSFDFDFRKGGLMYSRTKDILYFTGNAVQTLDNDRQPFLVPNSVNEIDNGDGTFSYVENSTPITKENMWDYYQNGLDRLNEEFLIDRSYVKLRFISLSYDLPRSILEKAKISGIKVTAYASNVFLWTPEDNTFIDPETSTFGNDLVGAFGEYSVNPSTRNYGVKLQLTF